MYYYKNYDKLEDRVWQHPGGMIPPPTEVIKEEEENSPLELTEEVRLILKVVNS